MDEDENTEMEIRPIKHDRWSVLILGLNWATQVVTVTANSLEQFTIVAAQHANYTKENDKFLELTKQWSD